MTRIVRSLAEISPDYDALFCDVWGCIHDGVAAFPEAMAALRDYRAQGGVVVLLTNSPRPRADVERQIARIGVPEDAWDAVATSGDSARAAMFRGLVGRRVHHVGPPQDEGFFAPMEVVEDVGIERVALEDAEGLVVTGPLRDTDRPSDYRALFLRAKQMRLPLLCANPDLVVDIGDRRVICAGAMAAEYTSMGGESLYFGKPHPPIYDLARRRLHRVRDVEDDRILCVGDGIGTDVAGALQEGLDALFVAGASPRPRRGRAPTAPRTPRGWRRSSPRPRPAPPTPSGGCAETDSIPAQPVSRQFVSAAPAKWLDFLRVRDNVVSSRGAEAQRMNAVVGTIPIEELSVGLSRSLVKTVGAREVELFAEVSEDRNPIHLCDVAARASVFGGRVAHGMLSASLFSAIIGERLPGHGTIYLGQSLRFRAPVRLGCEVTATVTVAAVDPPRRRATLACEARVGGTVVITGEAEVLVPSRAAAGLPPGPAAVIAPPSASGGAAAPAA